MKTFLTAVAVGLTLAVAGPALACSGDHGYQKTAEMIQQSSVSSEKKAALMQILGKSQADHDKYTASGDYGKAYLATDELSLVHEQLGK